MGETYICRVMGSGAQGCLEPCSKIPAFHSQAFGMVRILQDSEPLPGTFYIPSTIWSAVRGTYTYEKKIQMASI